jgi:hypothetical protein
LDKVVLVEILEGWAEEGTGNGKVAPVCRGKTWGAYALEMYGNAKLERRTERAVNS